MQQRTAVKAGQSEKNEETRLDAFEMKGLRRFCGFRGQQRKQMSGFLTKPSKD